MNYYIHTKTGVVQVDRDTAEHYSKRGSKVTSKTLSDNAPKRTAVSTAEDTDNHEKTHTNTEDN